MKLVGTKMTMMMEMYMFNHMCMRCCAPASDWSSK